MVLDPTLIDDLVTRALREDLDEAGDVTARAVVDGGRPGVAVIVAKQAGVIAGLPVAEAVFRRCDPKAEVDVVVADGDRVAVGDTVLRVRGDASALLVAERTALNFLQRLSGVATTTRAYVEAVEGTGAEVFDTRKTTPGLRTLEKYAVACGGGVNQRIGLFDQILIKENHFAWAGGDYRAVVERAVAARLVDAPIIAEVRDDAEAEAAVRGGADIVMLDNFEVPDGLRAGVDAVRALAAELGRDVRIEASGGVTLETIRAVAACGVDRISVGALTHSVRSLDLSMLVDAQADA